LELLRARVKEAAELYAGTHIVWIEAPSSCKGAKIGQFLMVRCGEGYDPLLPRAFSIHRWREGPAGLEMALLFTVVGTGTEWLSRRVAGDSIAFFGPLGHGYTVERASKNLLLIAGGIGVAPLVWMADERARLGDNITLLLGARSADQLFPSELLPPEVEVIACTDDGSAGRRALVSELLADYLPWADQAFACGPTPMFKALKNEWLRATWRKPVQALLEERMACGTGICYSCAVQTRSGIRLVCKDGPSFNLREVY
jgi:dihydroorotate dehydrogenase electron transfer subunit